MYLIEDLHTSYWADGYGGGLGVESTFIEWLKRRIDDLHADHSRSGDFVASEWTRSVRGIHLYDSIAVLDKGRVPRPEKRMTGVPAFDTTYGYDTERFIDDAHRAQIEAIGRPTARIGRLVREPIVTTRRVLARTMAKVPRSRR